MTINPEIIPVAALLTFAGGIASKIVWDLLKTKVAKNGKDRNGNNGNRVNHQVVCESKFDDISTDIGVLDGKIVRIDRCLTGVKIDRAKDEQELLNHKERLDKIDDAFKSVNASVSDIKSNVKLLLENSQRRREDYQ